MRHDRERARGIRAGRRGLRNGSRGFALIELAAAGVIVAVLAAIAVPVYARYVKYARTSEATDRMGEIVTAAKAYAVANPGATGVPMWPPSGGKGLVSLSGTPHFTYAITSGGGLSAASAPLTVRATGRAGTYMNKVTVTVTVPNYQAGAKPPVVAGF